MKENRIREKVDAGNYVRRAVWVRLACRTCRVANGRVENSVGSCLVSTTGGETVIK